MGGPVSLPPTSPPLPWQSPAWELVTEQVSRSTLPHALLVSSPRYTGKERFAIALARLLLCESPDSGLNCGHCHACHLSAAGSHGDFLWLGPEGKSRVIKIGRVRDAIAFAANTASQGRAKVIVISPAEAMNISAANALLKCLEEPPSDTYILLLAAQPHRLAATVRSRCRQLRLPGPGGEESLAWLDGKTADRGESEKWLKLAGSCPLLAEEMFNSTDGESLVASRLASSALLTGKVSMEEALSMVQSLELAQVLEQVAGVVRDRIRGADTDWLRSPRGRAVFALLDEVMRIQKAEHSGANPNRQLICELIFEKLHFLLGPVQAGDSI